MENIQITKDCIQQINNIGSTTYVNICNGAENVVSWGSFDILGTILAGLLCVLLVGAVGFMVYKVLTD